MARRPLISQNRRNQQTSNGAGVVSGRKIKPSAKAHPSSSHGDTHSPRPDAEDKYQAEQTLRFCNRCWCPGTHFAETKLHLTGRYLKAHAQRSDGWKAGNAMERSRVLARRCVTK